MPARIVGGLTSARDSVASKRGSKEDDNLKGPPGVGTHTPHAKRADRQGAAPLGDRLGGLKEGADRNLGAVSNAVSGAEQTLEDWALGALSKLRTYFHNAEEAAKRGIHYAEHLQQRQEETTSTVGQKVAAVTRDAVAKVESGVEGLSQGAVKAKGAAKTGLSRVEKAADYASETKEAVKSGIGHAEETAESAIGRVVAWFHNAEEAAKRGVHYTQAVGEGVFGAAEGAVGSVKSVAAGVASRATDVKEGVKKGIHYAESAYGDAGAALGRLSEKAGKAEDAGKEVLSRNASYVREVSPTSGKDEADLVSGGSRARKAWEQAGRAPSSAR